MILLYTEPALCICLLEQKKNLTPKEALRAIKVLHTLQENKKQQQQQPQLSLWVQFRTLTSFDITACWGNCTNHSYNHVSILGHVLWCELVRKKMVKMKTVSRDERPWMVPKAADRTIKAGNKLTWTVYSLLLLRSSVYHSNKGNPLTSVTILNSECEIPTQGNQCRSY